METVLDVLSKPDINTYDYANSTRLSNIQTIFWDQTTSKHSAENLFLTRFGLPPSAQVDLDIDGSKAYKAVVAKYGSNINDYHYSRSRNTKGECVVDVMTIVLYNNLIIEFNVYHSYVAYLYNKPENPIIEEITDFVRKFNNTHEREPRVKVLISSDEGFFSNTIAISKSSCSIEDHYNSDLAPVNKKILDSLNRMNNSGVFLLHGEAGTGKTNYLRYLISNIKKEVVIIPNGMISQLNDPEMLEFLSQNKNCVLIIEDAENFIIDRNQKGYSPISDILNIADGLLSDGLYIQIICTFNTKLSAIDPALLRKGRLIARYEFRALEPEKATNLSLQLGFKTTYNVPTSLTDVFNQNETDFSTSDDRIRFFKQNPNMTTIA